MVNTIGYGALAEIRTPDTLIKSQNKIFILKAFQNFCGKKMVILWVVYAVFLAE